MTIFREISWPLGCSQRLRVFFEADFCFEKNSDISNLISWNVHLFWILSFAKDIVIAENRLCFSCLQFADYYMWSRILSCGVILCFNHCYEIFFFEKFSFRKSWCCRKHVFVFEIVSLKGLNEFMIKLSFSLWLLGKKVSVRHYGKSFENFSVLGVDFLFVLES